ncbi:hypothetical protein HMPREF1639_01005 [Peptostreptococcus sp. MV1]|nr:hypothetical protein HMPREF1639_01005 [Peptostreptococcus sp. MV1]
MKIKNIMKITLAVAITAVSLSAFNVNSEAEIIEDLNAEVVNTSTYNPNEGTPVTVSLWKSEKRIKKPKAESMANELVEHNARLVTVNGEEKVRVTFKQAIFTPFSSGMFKRPSYIDKIVYSPTFNWITVTNDDTEYNCNVEETSILSQYKIVNEDEISQYVPADQMYRYVGSGSGTEMKVRTIEIPVREITKYGKTYKRAYLGFEVPAMQENAGKDVKKANVLIVE